MRFSVIIPVYNCEKFLNQCIDSIISQTYPDFELILVDDGSTDASGSICDAYSEKDGRIKVIHKTNGGANSARKAAADVISGEYVTFVDGDDWVRNSYLMNFNSIIEKYNPDMVVCGYIKTNLRGEKLYKSVNDAAIGIYKCDSLDCIKDNCLYDKVKGDINYGLLMPGLPSKVIKKDLYTGNQVKVSDQIIDGEDAALTFVMVQNAKSIFVSGLCDYYYRTNPKSVTQNVSVRMIESQKWIDDFLIEHADSSKTVNQIYGYSYSHIFTIIDRAVRSGYTSFKRICKAGANRGAFVGCVKAEINKISKGNRFRRYCIKNKFWSLLYLYHRCWIFKEKIKKVIRRAV